MVVARDWGYGKWKVKCLMGTISTDENKKAQEINGSDGCMTM